MCERKLSDQTYLETIHVVLLEIKIIFEIKTQWIALIAD